MCINKKRKNKVWLHAKPVKGDIIIGNDVWIGFEAVLSRSYGW